MKLYAFLNCCDKKKLVKKYEYIKKPNNETNFNIKKYHRYFKRCDNCGHYFSYLNFNITKIYNEQYSKSTYGNLNKIEKKFKKIINLSLTKSDNKNRVLRCLKFIRGNKVLDIGTGMGIFPFELRKKIKNLKICLLEKDKNLIKFLGKNFEKEIIKSEINYFADNKFYNNFFDFISINKVLEHIENPKIIMRKIKKILKNNGILYIEVPDAKASIEGKYREEFFIEHLHVFSMKSLRNTLKKIKFKIIKIKSIKENSGKYTLYAFCKKF